MARSFLTLVFASALAFPPPAESVEKDGSAATRRSIERGLGIVQKAARNYPTNRNCFSCHHQTLPMLAMHDSAAIGIDTDGDLMKTQLAFIREAYEDRLDSVTGGKSVGGRSLTAGYALWAFDLAGQGKDEFSDAFVSYLLEQQADDGHWGVQTVRPPSEESHIHTTVLAMRTMKTFARGEEMGGKVEAATEMGRAWLATAEPKSQEDLNAKYQHALAIGDAETVDKALQAILDTQQDDGGWPQLPGMKSDAYATGQTLHFLSQAPPSGERLKPAIERAIAYLLRTQKDDGSWFVETRSKPIQELFDNGDPHGKNQFISIAATSWAVAALAATTE